MGAEGEFALVREQMEKARLLAGQPVKRGSMAHDHDVYMVLADTAARLRDVQGLATYVPRLRELAERDNHQLYRAIAYRSQGVAYRLAGELDQAGEEFEKAQEIFSQLSTRWQLGRTLSEGAEWRQLQGDLAGARAQFERALEEFRALRAVADVERTQAALSRVGDSSSLA